jgi:hypothetical protein
VERNSVRRPALAVYLLVSYVLVAGAAATLWRSSVEDPARTVRAIVYHFRDPGAGFDRRTLSHAAQSSDAEEVVATALSRAEMGLRPGGFGMLIARQVADELVYNERGNEVLLVKHVE